MDDLIKKLGERIRIFRKERNLSQEQLGELAGLHANYVGQIERGEKNVTIESLIKITNGLNISLEQLFSLIDPMDVEDDLRKLIDLLVLRTKKEQAIALKMIQLMIDWEA